MTTPDTSWREWLLLLLTKRLFSNMAGAAAGDWFGMLWDNDFAVDVPYLPRALAVSLSSLANSLDGRAERLLAFTRQLIRLRAEHPVFRRADFLTGEERLGSGAPDVWWFRSDGRKMTQRNWRDGGMLTLGVFLNGAEIPTQTQQGTPVIDDTFLILFNAWDGSVDFTLPAVSFGRRWELELSSADPAAEAGSETYRAREVVPVEGRSLMLLRRVG